MPLAYIYHCDCLSHDVGEEHPEHPHRLKAVRERLEATGLDKLLTDIEAPRIDRQHLERVHAHDYLEHIFSAQPGDDPIHLDADTRMMSCTLEAAMRASGSVVQGVDLLMSGEFKKAFCAVRPPGHHAERAQAMGFCFFNNIAVGAAYALEVCGLSRVAILDFDVHHGNGTENIFSGDERVLFGSCFQHPLYPFSGADSKAENIMNIPLRANTRSDDFRSLLEQQWLPRLEEFKPEMIFLSAGFDGHKLDPLGGIKLSEEDFIWITRMAMGIAERFSNGRLLSALEGGYHPDALGRSVEAHLRTMLEG